MTRSRREFLKHVSVAGAGALLTGTTAFSSSRGAAAGQSPTAKPLAIASGNGLRAVEKAMEVIATGADALDAVIAGVNIVEEDPNDTSVGYGGLPNEDGVVELDAAVMHGPTHRGGGVAALRNIKTPSKVARLVMERTDHVLLVGEGALRFAKAHGFQEENLLTDKAREKWLRWKETMSDKDDWIPAGGDTLEGVGAVLPPSREENRRFFRDTGTIHCSAIDARGNISCVTTTSGLSYKIPGRVGDSPILGAGLYVDNEVGSAGSTGRGEANLVNCSSAMIVEHMRQGKSPEQACLDACKRIVTHTIIRRLRDDKGRPTFNVVFYALNKKGEYGAAAIYSGSSFAIHDGVSSRLIAPAYLYQNPNGR